MALEVRPILRPTSFRARRDLRVPPHALDGVRVLDRRIRVSRGDARDHSVRAIGLGELRRDLHDRASASSIRSSFVIFSVVERGSGATRRNASWCARPKAVQILPRFVSPRLAQRPRTGVGVSSRSARSTTGNRGGRFVSLRSLNDREPGWAFRLAALAQPPVCPTADVRACPRARRRGCTRIRRRRWSPPSPTSRCGRRRAAGLPSRSSTRRSPRCTSSGTTGLPHQSRRWLSCTSHVTTGLSGSPV